MKQMDIHSTETSRGSIQSCLGEHFDRLLGKNFLKDDSIQSHYHQGLHHYEIFLHLSEGYSIEHTDTAELNMQDHRCLAIASFQKALLRVGTCDEQLLKITIALLLTRLYTEDADSKKGEHYFYMAAEIAQQYLGDDLTMSAQGKELWEKIIEVYLECIDSTFREISFGRSSVHFATVARILIRDASRKRVQDRLKKAADTQNYIQNTDSYVDILNKIQDTFGPFRLSILSQESGEELINYNSRLFERHHTQNVNGKILTVPIFNESKNFRVIMDYGSPEEGNQPQEHHLKNIIYPIMDRLIRKIVDMFFMESFERLDIMSTSESQIEVSSMKNDYHGFISNIVRNYGDAIRKEGYESEEKYIDDCVRAIDICRMIMLYYAKNPLVHRENLPQDIDTISGGNITRSVLNMVRDMILLHTETMNGIGFPYSLSKNNILLAGRIFPIIRAYELADPTLATYTVRSWAYGGYFDSDILGIFLNSMKDGTFSKITPSPVSEVPILSQDDQDYYNQQIDTWCKILDTIASIGDSYCQFREAEIRGHIDMQGPIYLGAKGLGLQLLDLADIRKIIKETRHCATISDVPGGPPGKEDECLTDEGEEDSLRKGKLIEGTLCSFLVAPSKRTIQTALGMFFSKTGKHVTLPHPAIMIEDTLRNPKNQFDSALTHSRDNLPEWQKEKLKKFLRTRVSSSGESMDIIVAHTSTVRATMEALGNLYIPGHTPRKGKISNTQEFIFLFRGTGLVAIDDPQRGLLFPPGKWERVLKEVNMIMKKVFGPENPFYEKEDRRDVNLIHLHDLFLDRINAEKRRDPARVDILIKKLRVNLITKYFPGIIQGAGVKK